MKQQKLQISCLFLAALLGTSCSSENDPITPIDPANDPDAIELGITAGVSLTKSAITGWTNGDKIAVFATGTDYTAEKNNDHAVYTYNSSWANGATDKIYLTHEVATIYAYYPSTLTKPTDTSDPAVAISVFEGSAGDNNAKYPALSGLNNADKIWGSSWGDNSQASTLITASGEIDYMWAEDADQTGSQATASNGKQTPAVDDAVNLTMKHGLSMVSFRIYNDGTYTAAGKLTKIVLKNKDGESVLTKGTSPTMSLKNGAITEGTAVAATYTRTFTDAGGYVMPKKGEANATTEVNAKEAAKKFSILVLPDGSAKFDKNKVQVVFTIDGADYPVLLADPADNGGKWLAGKNYLYTAKLSGKELSITSVAISGWNSATGGDLNVN